MSVKENYAIIRERMQKACDRAGRSMDEVRLCAVSKYVDEERMQAARDLGILLFGENHAQELQQKKTFFERNGCEVHFIGQLQTNKIKYVCGCAGMVESVDRESLLTALQKKSADLGICTDALIQVNIGDEAQKGGVPADELEQFVQSVLASGNLRLRGLMCVPPALDEDAVRPYFRRMREMFEKLRAQLPGEPIDVLSMGMSHDFHVAIEEGATEVRVGSALFGMRDRL